MPRFEIDIEIVREYSFRDPDHAIEAPNLEEAENIARSQAFDHFKATIGMSEEQQPAIVRITHSEELPN